MRHEASRALFNVWQDLRGQRPAPDRADIEPTALAAVLGDIFILEPAERGDVAYRLAGSRVTGLFGRELKGRSFLAHFGGAERRRVSDALDGATASAAGLLIGSRAITAGGEECPVETLILPLVHRGETGARLIGATTVFGMPYFVGRDPVIRLDVDVLRLIWTRAEPQAVGAGEQPAFMPIPRPSGRPVFRVVDGGRAP